MPLRVSLQLKVDSLQGCSISLQLVICLLRQSILAAEATDLINPDLNRC
jgi:hypothetical protein